ncbi:hypothetical protein C8R44DRAFT_764448 [Mycena epipterygia]|nr:hypothetical protein C8R44DRAFT_764448 [Mycena epipterygia]
MYQRVSCPLACPQRAPAICQKIQGGRISMPPPPARNALVDPVVEQAVHAMDDEADSL